MHKKKSLIIFSALAIIAILSSIIAILDVEFVNGKNRVTARSGVMSNSSKAIERYKIILTKASIPYKLEETDKGEIKITWEERYTALVEALIDPGNLGIGTTDTEGLCAMSTEERLELISKLNDASLEFKVYTSEDGLACVNWSKDNDTKVQEIYPVVREMRAAEKRMLEQGGQIIAPKLDGG